MFLVSLVAVAVSEPPSVWLACCCLVLRVLYAFVHVTVPLGETRFAVCHVVAADYSGFPQRSRNFGVFSGREERLQV